MKKYLFHFSIVIFILTLVGYYIINSFYIENLKNQAFMIQNSIHDLKYSEELKNKKESLEILEKLLSKIDKRSFPEYVYKNLIQKYEEVQLYMKYYLNKELFSSVKVFCKVNSFLSPGRIKEFYPGIYDLPIEVSISYSEVVPYQYIAYILEFFSKKKALLVSSVDLTKSRANITFNILGVLSFSKNTTF